MPAHLLCVVPGYIKALTPQLVPLTIMGMNCCGLLRPGDFLPCHTLWSSKPYQCRTRLMAPSARRAAQTGLGPLDSAGMPCSWACSDTFRAKVVGRMVAFLTHAKGSSNKFVQPRPFSLAAIFAQLVILSRRLSSVAIIATVRPSPRSCAAVPRRNGGATSPDRRPRGGGSTAERQTEDASSGCTRDGRVAHVARPGASPISAPRPRIPGASPSPALEGQLHVEDCRRRAPQNCVLYKSERANRPITRRWPCCG